MVISRSPFRISFLGGGTDLAAFFREEEGAVVSAAINKFVQIAIKDSFDHTYSLSHTKLEICDSPSKLEHKIVRRVVEKYQELAENRNSGRGLEIVSMTDIPPGTGLGSSSSFTVALLHALKTHLGFHPSAAEIAQEACQIEIDDLVAPIGKQDQYMAAYGGLSLLRFLPNGEVKVEPVSCSEKTKKEFEQSIMLFYTGMRRQATDILGERSRNTADKRAELREMKTMAYRLKELLEAETKNGESRIREIGDLFHEGWLLKRTLASGITGQQIDGWYERARRAGAWGGKIVGAGGGGFLMLMCSPEKQADIRKELKELRQVPVAFENSGSRIVFDSRAAQ